MGSGDSVSHTMPMRDAYTLLHAAIAACVRRGLAEGQPHAFEFPFAIEGDKVCVCGLNRGLGKGAELPFQWLRPCAPPARQSVLALCAPHT